MESSQLAPGPLNHVALPSANPEATAKFYCELLGFEQTPRPPFSFRGSWLWRPETKVMLHLIHDADHQPALEEPINTRTHHVAFQTSDFDQCTQRLTAHNVDYVVRVLPDYGYRQLFLRDPDGNVIELGEWPSPEIMLSGSPSE